MTDHRSRSRRLNWAPLLGGMVGIGLSAWLLKSYGIRRIGELIVNVGWWGIVSVSALHVVQMLCSALGWRVIAGPPQPRQRVRTYLLLRWIREAVNNFLPFAQIGGEVVAWSLLRQRGAKLANAIAGTVADLSLEMVTQIIFTIFGVVLLLLSGKDNGIARMASAGVMVATILIAILFLALRVGVAGFLENALLRLGRLMGWARAVPSEGLNQALLACYRAPGRIARSGLWHMLSWLLGGVEVCLALHFLGQDVDIKTGLVIESLGQAAKALGFAVPGAIGVQEGGYIMVCAAFGLSAEIAIALSLIKRLREALVGIPALVVWQHCEGKAHAARRDSITGLAP